MFVWEKKKKTFPFETFVLSIRPTVWACNRYTTDAEFKTLHNGEWEIGFEFEFELDALHQFWVYHKRVRKRNGLQTAEIKLLPVARQTTFITITKRFETWSTSDNCDESIFFFLGWILDSRQLWGSIFFYVLPFVFRTRYFCQSNARIIVGLWMLNEIFIGKGFPVRQSIFLVHFSWSFCSSSFLPCFSTDRIRCF